MKSRWLTLVSAAGAAALAGFVATTAISAPSTDPAEREAGYAHVQLFTRVMATIREHYVDAAKVSYKNLTYGALRGMLSALDPHSQFLDPEEYSAMRSETEGQFGGVGIEITIRDSFILIVAPKEDGPSAKAGLKPGDKILRVDGKSTEKFTLPEIVKRLRGEPGTQVTITVMRDPDKEIRDFTVTRDIIKVTSVKDVEILPESVTANAKIGYIRITQFNEPTAEEFETGLRQLEAQGMTGLVIDLRNNPGGLLTTAAEVAGKFIPANEIIVTTEGRSPSSQRTAIRSPSGAKHDHYPVAVLVNNYSASGAEIVAGALKDLKKAIVIGETTFGKGSVQSVLPLPDESAIRLTTAKYYTPSHQVIHERGISPHITATIGDPYRASDPAAEPGGEPPAPDSGAPTTAATDPATSAPHQEPAQKKIYSKTEKVQRDTQLVRAIHALKGVQFYTRRAEPTPSADKTATP